MKCDHPKPARCGRENGVEYCMLCGAEDGELHDKNYISDIDSKYLQENKMTEEQIQYMVNRFLGWKLPDLWHPDGGIEFDADKYKKMDSRNLRCEPFGTNLFSATEAYEMISYMLEGMPNKNIELLSEDVAIKIMRNAYHENNDKTDDPFQSWKAAYRALSKAHSLGIGGEGV